jgi:uncharacterized protein
LELQLKIEWNEAKNRANIRKHGFDFADAEELLASPLLTMPDLREDYGEDRWITVGTLRETVVVLVLAELERDLLRVISLRKATPNEQKFYAQALQDGLETH